MTRPRWGDRPMCGVCGGPMRWLDECWWGCPPCLLSSIEWSPADVRAWVRARREWADHIDDANSTDHTAAWSHWLPPGANDPTRRRVSTYAVGVAFGGKAWRERRDQNPKAHQRSNDDRHR